MRFITLRTVYYLLSGNRLAWYNPLHQHQRKKPSPKPSYTLMRSYKTVIKDYSFPFLCRKKVSSISVLVEFLWLPAKQQTPPDDLIQKKMLLSKSAARSPAAPSEQQLHALHLQKAPGFPQASSDQTKEKQYPSGCWLFMYKRQIL